MAGGKSWAERKKQHQNTTSSVTVTLRGDLLAEVERLEVEMKRAAERDKWSNENDEAPIIAAQIEALQKEAAESEVTFVFRGISRGAEAKLLAKHPATDAQRAEYGRELPYNPDTYPPALMAACCVEPEELAGNIPEFTEIHEEWNTGQVVLVWNACTWATSGVGTTPKSQAASELLQRHPSESSSTTASL